MGTESTASGIAMAMLAVCFTYAVSPGAAGADADPDDGPAVRQVTAAEWLKEKPRPAFRAGHTLPRLTRYGWVLPLDARIALAEDWGYALEFGGYVDVETVTRLNDPESAETALAKLARSDPGRYPLSVICSRRLPGGEAPPATWTRDKDGRLLDGKAQSMDGTQWSEGSGAVFSPEAPDAVWKMAGEYRAEPLRALQGRGVPISIVLNGGEYGLGVLGFAQAAWSQDPRVVKAVGEGSWRDYASAKKARSERIIADVVRAAVPKRKLYVYYTAGGRTLRNKDWSIDDWGPQWKHMRGVSDLPSNEVYYRHFNDGFVGRLNLLTLALNAAGAEIATGDTLSYNWVCGGWTRGDAGQFIADMDRWTGFLKCYYTAGMVGANVGYYEYPPGGFGASFPADAPPAWLRQMAASSYVHALFSQVEDLVRRGDLLPGPMKHAISTGDPAYEFPTADETARVLVRKHRTRKEWLLAAWASDGPDREVRVRVPELGRLVLQARVCGSVYRATLSRGNVTLTLLDPEGSSYTQARPGRTTKARVDDSADSQPLSEGLLVWLAADTGVTKDADGNVSAWRSGGSLALVLEQADAGRRPQWVGDAFGGKPALRFREARYVLAARPDEDVGGGCVGPLTLFTVFSGVGPGGDNRIVSATADNGADYMRGTGFKVTDAGPKTEGTGVGARLKITGGELAKPLRMLSVGAMHGAHGPGFAGDLAEVLIYTGTLPPTKSALVERYLTDKYGALSIGGE